MSDAEFTLKFAIFYAIETKWNHKDENAFAETLRDSIFEELKKPQYRWMYDELLKEWGNIKHETDIT